MKSPAQASPLRLTALAALLLGTVLLARFSKPEEASTAMRSAGEAGEAASE